MAKWTDYPTKTTPVDTDDLMIYDATGKANKRVLFSGLWNWIVDKLTNAVISNLQTNNKTILGALNELNSKPLTVECTDLNDVEKGFHIYHWTANTLHTPTKESVINTSSGAVFSYTESADWAVQFCASPGVKTWGIRTKSKGSWSTWTF